jgi:hypothetical protein
LDFTCPCHLSMKSSCRILWQVVDTRILGVKGLKGRFSD